MFTDLLKVPFAWCVAGIKAMIGLIQLMIPNCSCGPDSDNWSWPFTTMHPLYGNQKITYVTCRKHGTVRLYNLSQMRIISASGDRRARGTMASHQYQEQITNVVLTSAAAQRV